LVSQFRIREKRLREVLIATKEHFSYSANNAPAKYT